jgi:hypothetical protein
MSMRLRELTETRRARRWPAPSSGRGVLAYRAKEVDFFPTVTNESTELTLAVD